MSIRRGNREGGIQGGGDKFSAQRKLCYFYVVIPPEDHALSNDLSKAVSSTQELAVIMKRNPHARFQSASTEEEAKQKAMEKIKFSKDTESIPSPKPERKKGRASFSAVEASVANVGAPASPTPKTDELLMLGREIQGGKNEEAIARVEKNPRMLCTESEFPPILQEGMKLNALHLAAKNDNTEMVKYVLNCISSMDFMRKIYPYQTEERLRAMCKHLSGCFLNTPDKMLQDTPLHMACKFNCVDCVELLISHPFCDIYAKNFDKLTPEEVIGQRVVKASKAARIKDLFELRFIVPIWRDEAMDGDAPILGNVAYIPDLGQAIPPPLLSKKFPDFSLSMLEPCKPSLLPKESNNQIRLFSSNPSLWKIVAYAGPTDEDTALAFRKVMKRSRLFLNQNPCTSPDSSLNCSNIVDESSRSPPHTPPREKATSPDFENSLPPNSSQLLLSPITSPQEIRARCESPGRNCSPLRMDMAARVRDVEKGLERIAFEYAHEMKIPWTEYWKFLGTYCDITTDEGLNLLEKHLLGVEQRRKDEVLAFAQDDLSNYSIEELMERLKQVKLNKSGGAASPDGQRGFCTNPKCKEESRFCNCQDVVPEIPYLSGATVNDSFSYGDIYPLQRLPFTVNDHDFAEIRRLNMTDSFDLSEENDHSEPFNWLAPEVYRTAPSSPGAFDIYEDCNPGVQVFFNGIAPGKLDFQVFQALKDCNENLDRDRHLTTFQWLNAMRAYGNAAMNFANPRSLTPTREWTPVLASTPVRHRRVDTE